MTFDELDELERKEERAVDPRETRRLIPIDTHSQLDTGYTGRDDDTVDPEKEPMSYEEEKVWRRTH